MNVDFPQPEGPITAVTLRDYQGIEADRWVQINHPDMVSNFIDRDADGRVDGGFLGLGQLLEAVEVVNGNTAAIIDIFIVNNVNGIILINAIRKFDPGFTGIHFCKHRLRFTTRSIQQCDCQQKYKVQCPVIPHLS